MGRIFVLIDPVHVINMLFASVLDCLGAEKLFD